MSIVAVAEVAESISVILASLVAMFGIDAWRREHVGKRQMELAEEVLALFYQTRDAISEMRSPMGFDGEGQTRKAGPDESGDTKKALDSAYVLVERYHKHSELFSRIQSLRYRFRAQLGDEASKPFYDLIRIVNELFISARQLGRYWVREDRHFRTDEERERHFERVRKAEAVFWEGSEEPDPIQPRVDAAIESMEKTCKGILASKGTLFGLINLPIRLKRG
jgi:hypothetical protein